MTTTIVIVLAIGFLFGAMVLMFAMGYQDTEQARAMQAEARQAEAIRRAAAVAALPGFFAPPPPAPSPAMIAFNDALVSRLEHDIQLEQAIVAQFVHHPSLDALYRHPTTPDQVHRSPMKPHAAAGQ